MKEYIDAAAFAKAVLCCASALENKIQIINELNVFPVPDGDTGTNMSLTMNNAAKELRKKSFDRIDTAADCVASALLRGARGNSGVILSLLFRGIAKRLKGLETAGASEFASAMNEGVEAAYKAVMKPAEGTILTVSRKASKAALDATLLGSDLEGMFICAIKEGRQALDDTIELNPVLKKAGVVDAGGKGYMVILETFLASLKGEFEPGNAGASEPGTEATPFSAFANDEITFAFDTVFIVRKSVRDVNLDKFRAYLASVGDSLVISEDDEIFKVHVHTDIPGEVLTESSEYGVLELAKIENMKQQHNDLVAGRHVCSTDDLDEEKSGQDPEAENKEMGFVAVCAGDGFESLFKELGADRIVTGGQTMNPSTEDILEEIEKTPASTVCVLPNNKNIIMAAEQCVPLTDKKVIVIPTTTVPQGISAMLNYNGCGDSPYETAEEMKKACMAVHTAQITYAARDSEFDGHSIHSGEYLALMDGKLIGNYNGMKNMISDLTWSLNDLEPQFVTVYYGDGVSEDEANQLADELAGVLTDADVCTVYGGQPVYYYVISAE